MIKDHIWQYIEIKYNGGADIWATPGCRPGWRWSFPPPPDLFGKGGVLTPEDTFVAASNTCYFMMVVWGCERFKMDLVSLEMEAVGEVEEHLDRTSWFKRVTFYPRIVVKSKSKEMVQRALDYPCPSHLVRGSAGGGPGPARPSHWFWAGVSPKGKSVALNYRLF